MLNKTSLIIISLLAVAVLVGFYGNFGSQKNPQIVSAWIEVSDTNVYKLDNSNGKRISLLQTGDQVQKGDIIKTGLKSKASIYVSDGSIIRISPQTEFVLNEISFDKNSKRLDVQIQLNKGKIWSKVFKLVTPDSVWKVRTTNTVATVRGTAFGVEFLNGKSKIIGSENNVEVSVVNPKTQKVIKGNVAMITAGKFIEITNDEIDLFEKEEKELDKDVKDLTESVLAKEEWVKEFEKDDDDYDLSVEVLEKEGLKIDEIRDEFIKNRENRYEEYKKEEKDKKSEESIKINEDNISKNIELDINQDEKFNKMEDGINFKNKNKDEKIGNEEKKNNVNINANVTNQKIDRKPDSLKERRINNSQIQPLKIEVKDVKKLKNEKKDNHDNEKNSFLFNLNKFSFFN